MKEFYAELPMAVIIAILGVFVAVLWRNTIYIRGAIFRPIGRVLDHWVELGCKPTATWTHKVLRFISYPLGRCIYCSTFHLTYDVFFVMLFLFDLSLSAQWLFVILPLSHAIVIMYMKWFVNGNSDLKKLDWDYMQAGKFFDTPTKTKPHLVEYPAEYLTSQELRELDMQLMDVKG